MIKVVFIFACMWRAFEICKNLYRSKISRYTVNIYIFFQLQLHAMRQMPTVVIDSSYTAKAFISPRDANGTKFKQVTFTSTSPYSIITLTITSLVITVISSLFFIGAIISLFFISKQDYWMEKIEEKKPLICSIALVSVVVTFYNTVLSIVSVQKYDTMYKTHPLYMSVQELTAGPVGILLAVDLLFLLIAMVICGTSMFLLCRKYQKWHIVLSFSI